MFEHIVSLVKQPGEEQQGFARLCHGLVAWQNLRLIGIPIL